MAKGAVLELLMKGGGDEMFVDSNKSGQEIHFARGLQI